MVQCENEKCVVNDVHEFIANSHNENLIQQQKKDRERYGKSVANNSKTKASRKNW